MIPTKEQAEKLEIMLNDKAELVEKRAGNRLKVKEFAGKYYDEQDLEEKYDLKWRMGVGKRIIDMQTARIKEYAVHRIAELVGLGINDVLYYERTSIGSR